jgi:hypothetical protein
MPGGYYFLLSALPALGELGERPPIRLDDFRRLSTEETGAGELIDALLLEHDLLVRESARAGRGEPEAGAVLTAGQIAGQEPLPGPLADESAGGHKLAVDALWEAYFRHVDAMGRSAGSELAVAWVGFEVALRNALADRRAEALSLEPEGYRVAEELADPDAPVAPLVASWAAAPDPLAALRALDAGRWNWLIQREGYFSFGIDEIAAYARKLLLLTRWARLSAEAGQAEARESS